jgi:hypothetical protein
MIIIIRQVHKETLKEIAGALPDRNNVELEIFGIQGIPEADMKAHKLALGLADDGIHAC